MLYSSIVFLFFFLPAVLVIHSLLPLRLKNLFLLAASVFFYAYGDARYLGLFLALTAFNYAAARGIDRAQGRARGMLTALSVGLNAAALIYYKYIGFLIPSLTDLPPLPLGISFFIFQSISYLLDVHMRRCASERYLTNYAAYILLFPQLIAGPIVRYSDVARELHERRIDARALETGMLQFLLGLASKVLLANRIGVLYDALIAISARGALGSLAALAACGLQYYFDFAGYSLMAIGIGRMLGFAFPQNFNHPYASVSVREFWKRWHMTLGSWLRTYVYLPLGGSRKGKARLLLNLMITWGLSGLWHGAGINYLCWGLYFGALIALEQLVWGKWLDRHRGVGRAYALTAVLFSWMIFSCKDTAQMSAFAAQLVNPAIGPNVLFTLACHALQLGAAVLLCVPGVCRRGYALLERRGGVRVFAMLALFALCVMELLGSRYNPFLYFRF